MTGRPPYWPYQCKTCCRYVSNPRVTYNTERIVAETGDCARCGPGVTLVALCWEDWFGWGSDPTGELLAEAAERATP